MNILTHLLFSPVYADTYKIPELTTVIGNITDTIVWMIGSLLVLLIVAIGIQFILTADNPQERVKLKSKLIWALIGLFIILSAKPLSMWIQSIL